MGPIHHIVHNIFTGADPGFQVMGGGGALEKNAPSGGRRENCWGISCENHDFTPRNHIFSNFRGARAGCAPLPGSAPGLDTIEICITMNYARQFLYFQPRSLLTNALAYCTTIYKCIIKFNYFYNNKCILFHTNDKKMNLH